MRRIVILGNSGSGKSTLARKLGAKLGLPVVHLDVLFYEPGWQAGDSERFRQRVAEALAGDAWIVDGNFLSFTGDLSLPQADTILWIEQPRWLSLARAAWRCVDPRARRRADLPDGCRDGINRETLSFIWTFERAARRNIEQVLEQFVPGKPVRRLRGDRGVAAFLNQAGQ
ncbi:MAG: AAA family ATPase [Pseudomonadota bacterium]